MQITSTYVAQTTNVSFVQPSAANRCAITTQTLQIMCLCTYMYEFLRNHHWYNIYGRHTCTCRKIKVWMWQHKMSCSNREESSYNDDQWSNWDNSTSSHCAVAHVQLTTTFTIQNLINAHAPINMYLHCTKKVHITCRLLDLHTYIYIKLYSKIYQDFQSRLLYQGICSPVRYFYLEFSFSLKSKNHSKYFKWPLNK